jgi:hypothetical protein
MMGVSEQVVLPARDDSPSMSSKPDEANIARFGKKQQFKAWAIISVSLEIGFDDIRGTLTYFLFWG